jgi:hypothetical protein
MKKECDVHNTMGLKLNSITKNNSLSVWRRQHPQHRQGRVNDIVVAVRGSVGRMERLHPA